MESLIEKCVAISGAPADTTEQQLLLVIHKHVPNASIQRLEFFNSSSWIVWLDSPESVEALCDNVQKGEISTDIETHQIIFYKCDGSDIPKSWIKNKDVAAREKQQDEHTYLNLSGATHGFSSVNYIFDEQLTENSLRGESPEVLLSNLPSDIDEDYLEMYFEERYGSDISAKVLEFYDDRTVAILHFGKKGVNDRIITNQPFEMEGQLVSAELFVSDEYDESKTIEVTAEQDVINERSLRTIKMYFRNSARSGGGEIAECTLLPGRETIQIIFESAAVAKNVSTRKDHHYKDKPLQVVLLDAKLLKMREETREKSMIPKAIKITNLPDEVEQSVLELFFEDAETFGKELHVVNVDIDRDQATAFVEFKEFEAVSIVMKAQPLELEGQCISIEVKDEQSQQLPCTVEVKGPAELLTKKALETLKLYFKSTKRSGGGHVTECILVKPGVAEITFETNEVARRVAEKDDHMLKAQYIDVRLKSPVSKSQDTSADESNKLLILDVGSLDGETIALHLEDMFQGVQVISIDSTVEFSSAVVAELDGSKSVQTVLKHQTIHIEGQTLRVQLFKDEPAQLCTIEVRGLTNIDDHLDVLKLYFKNSSRSGGGDIIKCAADRIDNAAYFTFESEEVARRVVNRPEHTVKGQPLAVSLCQSNQTLKNRPNGEHEKVLENKILITNLPRSVDEEFIELYFEDLEIQAASVKINFEDASAIVEFHDKAAVDFILRRQPLEMDGESIKVERYHEKKQDFSTIKVRGQANVEKNLERLKLYFKNTKRSGGGPIVTSTVGSENDIAYFTFQSQEVAERVINTNHSKQGLEVSLVTDKYPSDNSSYQSSTTVKVRGVEEKLTQETLSLYFESKKRSGGGEIETFTDDVEDKSTVYIKFKSPEDARNIIKRKHQVQDCALYVSLYVPPPFYDNKVLIQGLKSTKDTLSLFLGAKMQIEPISIYYHEEEEDTVLVTMKTNLDFEKLQKVCRETPLEGTKLKVSRIQVSNCICVSNIGPDVTKDTIEYYFENRDKSGGGCVEKVVMNDTDEADRSCLVYFEDYTVIDSIIQRQHILGNKLLDVNVFQLAIGRQEGGTSERTFQVPKALEVEDINAYKVKFVTSSMDFRKSLEQEMLQHYTKVKWHAEIDRNVELHCTLTKDVKGCHKIAKTWERQAKSAFKKEMEVISLHQIVVLQDIKQKVIEFLKNMTINDPADVAIYVENEQTIIYIVGMKNLVDDLKRQIEATIRKIIDDAEKERQKVSEVFTNLEPTETKLMVLQNVSQNLEDQFPDVKVTINPQKNEIQLEGMISSVQQAKLAIYDMKNTYEKMQIENISALTISLLKTESIQTNLDQTLKSNGITAVWKIDGNRIEVCCIKSTHCKDLREMIGSFLKEDALPIERDSVPDLETEKWRKTVDDIYGRNLGKVKIVLSDDASKIIVCATADVLKTVMEEIKGFIDLNTVVAKTISSSKDVCRLIDKHCKHELQNICKTLQTDFVSIKLLEQYKGFEIRGLQKGVQDASTKLQGLFQRIKQKKHTVTKPGISEHISSVKGKDSIHTIETTLPCIVAVEDDNAYRQLANKAYGREIYASCSVSQNRNINIWQGDITELEVDIIVNPSDLNLGFSGGLGKAIISKGGITIRYECESYINDTGNLEDGEVFVSGAGNLKATYIAHIKSQEWKPQKDMDKVLEDTVLRCLSEAAKLKAKSIAIPAIGCGVNRFPVDIATSSIVKAVQRALLEYQDSSVREIFLCDMNARNVDEFTHALCNTFGSKNVEFNDHIQLSGGTNESFTETLGTRPKRLTKARGSKVPDRNTLQPSKYRRPVTVGHSTVTVVKGEIAKQRVDVIVNTTSNNLDLQNGRVSSTLLKAAGPDLQKELFKSYPDGIEENNIAVSSGHKLHCNIIIHTSIPCFKDDNQSESIAVLHKFMFNSLEEAQRRNYCSIAFPAIGTGALGYPHSIVASEMFKAIIRFLKSNPQSCIKDIRFIVYQMDTQSIQAFESEEQKLLTMSNSRNTVKSTLEYDALPRGVDSGHISGSGSYSFGSITVKITQGDITKEDCACIVNSTNEDLNLEIGKVSKTLLQIGGIELREEIQKKKSDMKRHKISVTLAPGLACKAIIHTVVDKKDLTKTVKKCLVEAENGRFTSIAFPALGTGHATKESDAPQDIAKSMIKAVTEFSKTQPKYLQEVRFVILEGVLFQEFQKAAELSGDSKTWLGNIWKGVKNAFGMSASSFEREDETLNVAEKFNSVTFVIIALEEDIVRKAIKKLEQSLEKEMHTKVIDDHIIQNLEDHQIDEMNCTAMQCHVHMTMEKNKGIIKLSGMVGNVTNASEKIKTLLRDAERMELMRNIAQWFYIEVTQTCEEVVPYEKDINLAIEIAYKQKKDSVAFADEGIDYILDFASMEEHPEHNKNEKVKVIRRDLVKGGAFEPPVNWEDMGGGNLRVVSLKPASKEYDDIEQKFLDSVQQYKDTHGQFRDWTVTKIERVQNKTLWEQYQSKKKQLEEQNPKGTTNERELWHGTSAAPVDSINAHGFNRSFCGKNATVFGDGVYFAINAKYSAQSTYSQPDSDGIKIMYLCLVLTGEFVKGEKGMRVPPPKLTAGPNALYDSVTNDIKNPHMFIIFHDTQACPEYIIYFKE